MTGDWREASEEGDGAERGRAEAVLAVAIALVMVVVGAVTVWLLSRPPVHQDMASVSSTVAVESAAYAAAEDESRQLARALAVRENMPGLSLAVAVNGEVVWAEGFGWADVVERTPMTADTRFRLGALSKPLAAFAAARLHDQGALDLDAPIQRYVPHYQARQWTVTTRQLLGDVAGIHRIRGDNNDAMPGQHCDHLDAAVALLAEEPLLFEPGTQHRYSIWGWVLVSAAVEGASGEPFDVFMTRQVFEPLGLARTVAEESEDPDEAINAHAPRVMSRMRLGVEEAKRPDYSCLAGGAAFISTPADLARFGAAMSKPGLLKAETIEAMYRPGRLASGAATTYGLGWTVRQVPLAGGTVRLVSHRGSPSGGSVSLLVFPDRGLVVAVAANGNLPAGVEPFAMQVAEAFARQPDRTPGLPRATP